ncbi:DUF2231 domain-containing protein [Paracraurococcus lichenis]|uniref:Hemerythrin domain-containing protein n=1 Tax=Paracraurococcus lichenis TaxID=3064888 RepID=A0ABT9DWS7_9PROT|nr:DUF2231 domain-containing protein [Paracraurococcus sp. LOR1-02]MDO9708356.1 hemerythrin domain-containing protein [Paracraurococcus sp. LOR1-02]
MAGRQRGAEALVGRIEAAERLDPPGYAIGNALARPAQIAGRPARRLGNALHGTGYGHPVHPMLVTLPIGAWTLALGMDLLARLGLVRGRAVAQVADTALGAGAVGAVAAAATGIADWQYTDGRDRRLGLVHGLTNTTALGLMLLSLRLRAGGRRGAGQAASMAGWGAMALGGYLGGHLVYRRRVGVDHADRSPAPREWEAVLPLAELQEDRPRRVEVWDADTRQEIGIALVLHRGRVHAMGARCSHAGGPLDQGWVLEGRLVCPWHGSRYDLATGEPMDGPSTCPQPRYALRIRDGMVEIRREQEPGDEVVTRERVARAAGPQGGPRGRRADDVLREHHAMLRRMFARIEAMPREDPARRDLLRMLAQEMEIHEYVEDRLFYPAVRAVSEDVAVAHAEHRQLADLLAETLKLSTATPEFEAHLRALHAALDHHAGSEERSMFPEAERLGEARLREIGHALEALLEQARESRARQAFRALKVRLLEGV